MTAQQTLSAVVSCIRELFPDTPVYAERIPQGFERPCFFVSAKENEKPVLGPRVARRIDISIDRRASNDEDAAEMGRLVTLNLSSALEWLHVADRPRHTMGISAETDIEKGVTTIKTAYFTHVLKKFDDDLMQNLDHTEKIKD